MSSKVKMKVKHEPGTTWITVKGSSWKRNKYDDSCIDTFDDVWLRPYMNANNLYVTALGPDLYFSIVDGCLEETLL